MTTQRRRPRGFTLVELVITIVVIGILGASVALFIDGPVRAYFDTIRRARLTDSADTVTRRMARELRDALPNSVRISSAGGSVFVEFIPVRDLGRYRAASAAGSEAGGIDPLDFSDGNDAGFQVLGRPVTVPADAQLVVANYGSGSFDAYGGANRRTVTSAVGSAGALTFTANGTPLPGESPEHRFYLVNGAISFVCTPGAGGAGRIERIGPYPLQATQPTSTAAAPLAGATRALLAENVGGCNAELGATLATLDQVALQLQFAAGGETVTLYTQVQLGNRP